MSFNTAPGRAEYTASAAQTIFTFSFKIYNTSDVKVYLTPTGQTADDATDILIETTDYAVTINGDNGGDVTLTSGATLNDAITLVRDLPVDRDTEYQQNGDLTAAALNEDQDYQTYLILDGSLKTNERALIIPDSAQDFDTSLPAPGADKMFVYASDGKSIILIDPASTSFFKDAFIVNSMQALLGVDENTYGSVNVRGYYAISDGGGDLFNWDSTIDKSTANAGTIIDPGQTLANQGTGIGNGCWARQYSGAVKDLWFGDNISLKYLIETFSNILIEGDIEYTIEGDGELNVSNLVLSGNGKVTLTHASQGVHLVGNNNHISNITINYPTKSSSPTVIYKAGLTIEGDNNTVDNIEAFNIEGIGIAVEGRDNNVMNCKVHDNIMGIWVTLKGRRIRIENCDILYNDVAVASGADGILLHRSCMDVQVLNCNIGYNGEHGVYAQGQRYTIAHNTIHNNSGSGLKFGSYETGLFFYPDETQSDYEWVVDTSGAFGPVDAAYYGLQDLIISNNRIFDNAGSGIYFQPSVRKVLIEGNIINDNIISFHFFNYTGAEARLEDIYDVVIENNTIYNGNIAVAGYSGLIVTDNDITNGYIQTYAASSTTEPRLSGKSIGTIINSNQVDIIKAIRCSDGSIIKYNTCRTGFELNDTCLDLEIIGNTITTSAPIDFQRIARFNYNKVIIIGDISFNYDPGFTHVQISKEFIGNNIEGNDYTGTIFVTSGWNSGIPILGIFSGNTIVANVSLGPVVLEGEYTVVNGNLIVGKADISYGIDCYGDNMTITGNVVRHGSINLRNDSANIVVGNKVSNVSGIIGTNIIANNG